MRARTLAFCGALISIAVVSVIKPPPTFADRQTDKLLRLLKKRPRRMTRETWLEQRREAARELGRKRDRRAVPALLKIIRKERFDVILEIAIDALGEIGDQKAILPLKKLLVDPSLDSYVRDAVAGALKKLGSDGDRPKPAPKPIPKPIHRPGPRPIPIPKTPEPLPQPTKPRRTDLADRLGKEQQPFADLPDINLTIDAELIAIVDRWDVFAGAAELRYDGAAEQTLADLGLASRMYRQVERKAYGYTIDGLLDFNFRLTDTGNQDASWDLDQGIHVNPEIRYYPFRQDLPLLFGQISGGFGYTLNLVAHDQFLERRLGFVSTLSAGGGPGYGRIFDLGARMRLRRFLAVLEKAGLLTGKIDKAIGDQIIYAWYQQRNHLSTYTHLGYTLKILRQAELLASDPIGPDMVYRLVRVIDDPQLDDRPQGMMFRLGYGYARSFIKDADDIEMGFLYFTGELTHQWTIHSFSAKMRFFYQMLGEPDFYGLSAESVFTHYLYNKYYDALGALSATISAGFSNQPGSRFEDGGLGFQLLAGGAYTRFFNRGTRVVASIKGGLDHQAPMMLVTLEAQYGLARGSFSSSE